jgi:outer membrane protein
MIKRTTIILMAILLSSVWCLSVSAEETEIGVVDLLKVIDQSKQGKKSAEEITANVNAAKKDLQKREDKLVALKKEIEGNAMTLSRDDLAEKERRYQELNIEYQGILEGYQKTIGEKNAEINKAMLSLVKEVVDKIGNEKGYLLILELTTSGVVYHTDAIDLTDEVIRRLNDE